MTRQEQIKQAAEEFAELYMEDNRSIVVSLFMRGAEWADEHQPSPWISVEERLPPKDGSSFLVKYEHDGFIGHETALYSDGGYRYCSDGTDFDNFGKPTHWMPIPTLKKGE